MKSKANQKPFPPELVAAAKAGKALHAAALMRYPNVCGVGVGFKVKGGRRLRELAIRVYVREKVPLGKLKKADRLPRSIEGIPVDVIVRKPSFRMFDPFNPSPEHAALHSVLLGGISIAVLGAAPGSPGGGTGTLGGSVFDNSSLMNVMLTNWHVACKDTEANCADGVVVQPSEFDNAGRQRSVGRVLRSVISPEVDSAILGLDGTAFLTHDVLNMGPIGRAVPAEVGMTVLKSGRTSGLTSGTITDISEDFDIDECEGPGCHRVDQIRFEGDDGMVQLGDSGSLLLDTGGNVVGLVSSASGDGDIGGACHIQDVLNALNINLTSGMTQQEMIAATHSLDA